MEGHDSWIGIAVMASMIPFVKAKPQEILSAMKALWFNPEPAEVTDQMMQVGVQGYAAAHGKVEKRSLDDPYWETVFNPEELAQYRAAVKAKANAENQ